MRHGESSPAWSGPLLSVLRLVAGLLFLEVGTMKLFGFPPAPMPMPPIHFHSELWLAGMLETWGGLAIVLGLFTRPVAFILSGEMAVAYFQAHAPKAFFPVTNNGALAVLFCFLFLYLAGAGGGPWSVDAALARARRGAPPTA